VHGSRYAAAGLRLGVELGRDDRPQPQRREHAGTPEKDVCCVERYQPGQFAPFQDVDKIGLQGVAVPIDLCIADIATR
jgi:hypothetical protein